MQAWEISILINVLPVTNVMSLPTSLKIKLIREHSRYWSWDKPTALKTTKQGTGSVA